MRIHSAVSDLTTHSVSHRQTDMGKLMRTFLHLSVVNALENPNARKQIMMANHIY